MMDDLNALLSQMSPEELEQLLGMGTLDERGGMLQQQMAQAEALRQPSGRQASTGWGAAFGGIADGLRNIQGTQQMDTLRQQQEALLNKKDAGRGKYVDALRRRMGPGQQMQPTEDVLPAIPFGM